ncbi:AmiS/UreI family transporter [Paeniglutamicibacter gangotriensis]|uniref:Putative urease accessory protein UreI n=1 Tax=Paeniglutamicibacter gangotriensis Lz1y TaxID=1276920 RepID=M7NKU4_9MICC|nr:AmiS/UreI family transporter [Paeniglutamicibacter gangotriensis]EMQ99173.1 putative urease accessory protein UreI [Paeniglutamicibacter gangotriensis Lz1y]
MSNVGLLYVGAVLFINGLMLIGKVPGKSGALMNLFVGGMQSIFPTIIIAQANEDPAVIFGASGLYLFAFTYLYVGINQLYDLPGDGLGWFSLFVAVCAVVFGTVLAIQFQDPVTAVMWFLWAVLWFLFFLVLGLHMDNLTITTGWFTLIVAHISATIPALLLLTGTFKSTVPNALWMAVAGLLALLFAFAMGRRAAINKSAEPQVPAPQAG